MSNIHNGKEIVEKHINKYIIVEVYHGLKLVWQAVKSCFGAGFWRNDKPWSNTEGWKNNI